MQNKTALTPEDPLTKAEHLEAKRLEEVEINELLAQIQKKYLPNSIGRKFKSPIEEVIFCDRMLSAIEKEREILKEACEKADDKMGEWNAKYEAGGISPDEYEEVANKIAEECALADNNTYVGYQCKVKIAKRREYLMKKYHIIAQ